ncbi:hypothetical protein PFTANZ_03463 [Plasmodium falciparum Tanzania (2000708)]|uniref:Uncharacterized protein n=2 Tax=Plasmodium falciparum TaxID=5833 RepID=A0A024W5T0_PLAFA|nr:hypothetical protein PFTANZ_03463 [Plasmodium falciparum Tanzania (2000708)]ETW42120.1 hypothetical protein PFNF135_03618 [Plasmodium falciparum NF135/5.C10]
MPNKLIILNTEMKKKKKNYTEKKLFLHIQEDIFIKKLYKYHITYIKYIYYQLTIETLNYTLLILTKNINIFLLIQQ